MKSDMYVTKTTKDEHDGNSLSSPMQKDRGCDSFRPFFADFCSSISRSSTCADPRKQTQNCLYCREINFLFISLFPSLFFSSFFVFGCFFIRSHAIYTVHCIDKRVKRNWIAVFPLVLGRADVVRLPIIVFVKINRFVYDSVIHTREQRAFFHRKPQSIFLFFRL